MSDIMEPDKMEELTRRAGEYLAVLRMTKEAEEAEDAKAEITQLAAVASREPPLLIEVEIQGRMVKALVDTGACETCIREPVAEMLGWVETATPCDRRGRELKNADRSPCSDQGRSVMGQKYVGVRDEAGKIEQLGLPQVTIMKSLCVDIILSLGFCKLHGWIIDTANDAILMEQGKRRFKVVRRKEVVDPQMAAVMRAEDTNGLALMARDTVLAAGCNSLVEILAPGNVSGGPFVFCPCFPLPWGQVSISEGLFQGRLARMFVTNEGMQNIVVPAGTPMGCTELLYTPVAPRRENWYEGDQGNVEGVMANTEEAEKEKIDLPELDEEIPDGVRKEYEDMLEEYREVFRNDFSKEAWRTAPFRIELVPEAQPAKFRSYRFNEDHKAKLRILLAKYVAENVIEESSSPWASPAFFVPKPGGGLRFVVDFRHLNKYTRDARWPLPLIDDVLDELKGSCLFSKFDAHSGFFQMPIDEYSRELTAFVTPLGLYQFTRLPMGARNGASLFSRAMADMVKDLKGIALYLDDTNVHSGREEKGETWEETYRGHKKKVEAFLIRCKERNLKLNGKKCKIGCKETKFLGHIVSEKGISPDPEKVKKVQDMLPPENVSQLSTFLGLVNYYRSWIRNCAARQRHLTKLMHKDTEFIFSEECKEQFEDMKRVLTSEPIMRHYPDPGKEFILFTDASDYAIGAVLAQLDENGREQVVAYQSRMLTAAEQKYATYEKECLAIVDAVQKFKVYLHTHFKVYTDHHSLKTLMKWKNPKPRVQRWLEVLSMYSFTAYYRAGCENLNADAMSRMFAKHIPAAYKTGSIKLTADTESGQSVPPEIKDMADDLEFMEMGLRPSFSWSSTGVTMAPITRIVENDEEDLSKFNAEETLREFQEESGEDDLDVFRDFEELIGKEVKDVETKEIFCINDIVFEPFEATFRAIINPHSGEEVEANEGLTRMNRSVSMDTIDLWIEQERLGFADDAFAGFDEAFRERVIVEIEDLIRARKIKRDEIVRIRTSGGAEHFYRMQVEKTQRVQYYQLIIPYRDEVLKQSMIRAAHMAVGHAAVERTFQYLSTRVFWARMRKSVEEYCEACQMCQERGKDTATNSNPYKTMRLPEVSAPHQRISIDLMGPIRKSMKGNQYIIFGVDHFSKWVYGKAIPNKEAVTIAQFLVEEIYFKVGCPEVIKADGGREFDNVLNKEITKMMRMSWSQSTPYHPQANGQVERFNQTFQAMIAKGIEEHNHLNWDEYVAGTIHAYNVSVNTATGFTPFMLQHGRECKEWIDRILPDRLPEELQGSSKEKYADYYYKVMWRLEHFYKQCSEKLDRRHSLYTRPRTVHELKYGFKQAEYYVGLIISSFLGKAI